MRMMIRWSVPVEAGNDAIEDGTITEVIQSMIETLKPEAAYFMAEGGDRAGIMVFDMTDPAQIPQIAEPLFMNLDAAVEFIPVMNAEDLERALDAI